MPELLDLALPGNPRYQPKSLQQYFGYDYLYRGFSSVEISLLQTLGEIGVIPPNEMATLTQEKIDAIMNISTTAVDRVEREITHHDARAWVRLAQEIFGPLARYAHLFLTSYDPIDTGRIFQFINAHNKVVKPLTLRLISILSDRVREFSETVQIGRTHGQHAVPITVGFWLATVLQRILFNAREVDRYAEMLVGKITGPVGASNAVVAFGIDKRCGSIPFERRVLSKLGLRPALISTQILPPEPLAYYLYSVCMLSASLAQFGRDCRHLMRSEIGEVIEPFEKGQVGSSTMAGKRNPIHFEQLEGMWEKNIGELVKVSLTMISEHQRDLTGSSVARDFPIIIVNTVTQLETLLRAKKNEDGKKVPNSEFLSCLTVNEDALKRNLEMSAGIVIAEPLYIAIQLAGYQGDAHELVNRKAMPIAQQTGISLFEAVRQLAEDDDRLAVVLAAIPPEIIEMFGKPERYIGDSKERALKVADAADLHVSLFKTVNVH